MKNGRFLYRLQNVKSATRPLAEPISDISMFYTSVQSVIAANPFACVAYMTAKLNHDLVEKTKEGYTLKIVYADTDAKTFGNLSDTFSTISGSTSSPYPSS